MNIKAPKVPDVDIKGPKVDIDYSHGIQMPDVDLNLKSPKVKGDVDVSLPKASEDDNWGSGFSMPGFKGEGPDVDVNLPKAPMPTFYGIDGSILGE